MLGENSHCPYSMFQIDDHFLGIQAHPEFEEDYVKELMISRAETIGKETLDYALLTINRKPNRAEITSWIVNFICTKTHA